MLYLLGIFLLITIGAYLLSAVAFWGAVRYGNAVITLLQNRLEGLDGLLYAILGAILFPTGIALSTLALGAESLPTFAIGFAITILGMFLCKLAIRQFWTYKEE